MVASMGTMGAIAVTLIICGSILAAVMVVAWACLRTDNKIGPLASAEQQYQIEKFRADALLRAKNTEALMAEADAKVIEAQAKVIRLRTKALNEQQRSLIEGER